MDINKLIRAMLTATSDQAMLVDRKGVVLAANEAMANRLGISLDELEGKRLRYLFDEDTAKRRMEMVRKVAESKEPQRFEDVTKAGVVFEARILPVEDDSGRVERLVIFSSDIAGPKKTEEQRIRLATAIEQAAEAVLILDSDFRIEYVNQAFEEMTGFSQKEAKGRRVADFYAPRDRKRTFPKVVETMAAGEAWTGQCRNLKKDGTEFQCRKTISPIRGKRGVPLGFVSIWRDDTQQAALEKQLRQAQKMEAVGALAGGIAHDFNNILGPIILHTELCLDSLEENDPSRESFAEILKASARAKALVDQILNLSRARELDQPIPFQLSSIVKECVKLLRPTLPSTISISFENLTEEDVIQADPTQLHQVIMNVCTNAAQAIGQERGAIGLRISDRPVPRNGDPQFPAAAAGDYIELMVADTGCGIEPAHMEKIFDPFFTTKSEGMGTGLGLAVVHNIIARLHGALHVDSLAKGGTVFKLLFPKSPLGLDSLSPQSVAEGQAGLRKILLVDDEKHLIESARQILEERGYEVLVLDNAYKALALFRQDPDRFDLVLADAALPEMNGLELAKELLLLRGRLPVILCSSHAGLISTEELNKQGLKGLLQKPFQDKKLLGMVSAALGEPVTD